MDLQFRPSPSLTGFVALGLTLLPLNISPAKAVEIELITHGTTASLNLINEQMNTNKNTSDLNDIENINMLMTQNFKSPYARRIKYYAESYRRTGKQYYNGQMNKTMDNMYKSYR